MMLLDEKVDPGSGLISAFRDLPDHAHGIVLIS